MVIKMELLFLCLKVFFARILDVSIGTMRTIVMVKGKNAYASIIGFFEVMIWFLIVKEILTTDNSIWIAISYSAGFATGTYIGGYLSKKLITGNLNVQIITINCTNLVDSLRNEGYAVTVINVEGKNKKEEKYMLFIEIKNKNLNHLTKIIKKYDHNAFIVIHETKYVQNGFINNVIK